MLLVLVLVLQQSVLAAHSYDHDIRNDSVDCGYCVVVEASAGTPADSPSFTLPAFTEVRLDYYRSNLRPQFLQLATARSPPPYVS